MFKKWDIIYISKFPETVVCSNPKCRKTLSFTEHKCKSCNHTNHLSNIVEKVRPIILWLDQTDWFDSMAFAIPLSASKIGNDKYNQVIALNDFLFLHSDKKYERPMRAMIHQATRIDGNVLNRQRLIGKVNNSVLQIQIENKLREWLKITGNI